MSGTSNSSPDTAALMINYNIPSDLSESTSVSIFPTTSAAAQQIQSVLSQMTPKRKAYSGLFSRNKKQKLNDLSSGSVQRSTQSQSASPEEIVQPSQSVSSAKSTRTTTQRPRADRSHEPVPITGLRARYVPKKRKKGAKKYPPWLDCLLRRLDKDKKTTTDKLEIFGFEYKTWEKMIPTLIELNGNGRHNFFCGKFWGNYFDREKPPRSIRGQLSVNGDGIRKVMNKAWAKISPNSDGDSRCYFLLASSIRIHGKSALHAGFLVAVKKEAQIKYFFYETMQDKPDASFAPMNFVPKFVGLPAFT